MSTYQEMVPLAKDNIFQGGPTGFWGLAGGTARPLSADEVKATYGDTSGFQSRGFAEGSGGWDPQHGGGTTGAQTSLNNFITTLGSIKGNWGVSDATPITPTTPAPSTSPEFRPRGANESMTDYLTAKQGAGVGGVNLGPPAGSAAQLALAPAFTTTSGNTGNNNRSLMQNAPGPGLIKGYDTTNNYAPVYVPKGMYVPGVSLYQKPTGDVTPNSLQNTNNLDVSGATGDGGAGTAKATIAGATSTLQQTLTPTTELLPAEQKQQTLLDQMASLTGQYAQKAADQLTAEQSANLPQLKNQFADINAQILSKTAEYNALETANNSRPVTMDSIIGSQRAILNAKASDIGLLQAQAQGLQGQISVAQETANRAIDLKYSTIEAGLQTYKAQLDALMPELNREEKAQAEAQQQLIAEQNQKINDAKQSAKDQTTALLGMISKFPDAKINLTDSIAQAEAKLSNSKIYQQATRLAGGGSGGTPISSPIISNSNTQHGTVNDGALKGLPPATANLIKQIANYQMDITKVTSLAKGERQKLAEMVSAYDPTYDMSQYAARSALRKDFESGKSSQNIRSLNTAVGHLSTLQAASDKLQNGNYPFWNKVGNWASSATGDPKVSNFLVAANAVEAELATVFKGQGATDTEIAAWRQNLNQNMSPAQLKGAITQAVELMGSRLNALKSQYEMGMGKPADFKILNDSSRTILQKMGVDVNGMEPAQTGNTNNLDSLRTKYSY